MLAYLFTFSITYYDIFKAQVLALSAQGKKKMLLPNIRVYGFRTFSSHTYSLFPICYNLTISPSKFSNGIQNSSSIEYTRNLDTKKTFSVKSIALRNIHHVSYVSLHTRSIWDSSRFFKHSVAIKEPMSFEYTCETFTRY